MKVYRPVFTRNVIIIDTVWGIVSPLIIVSPLLIWAWKVYGSDSSYFWGFISFIPFFVAVLLFLPYLTRIQWKMWVRKERCATYFQTQNTLAIKIPFQPVKFVCRQECVGFMPGGERLLLRDGTVYELPGAPAGDVHDLSRGEEIIKSWWPEIDIEDLRARRYRELPGCGGIVAAVVTVVLLNSSAHMILKSNGVLPAGELGSLVFDGWLLFAFVVSSRVVTRRYHQFVFPLPVKEVAQEIGAGGLE